jgi:hypothetical protein
MPQVVVVTIDPNSEEETLAAFQTLTAAGYFNGPMEALVQVVTTTIVENAKLDICSSAHAAAISPEFFRGVIQGAQAVAGHLAAIRERYEALVLEKRDREQESPLSAMSLGDGTLGSGVL